MDNSPYAFSLRNPWLVIAISIFFVFLSSLGISKLSYESDIRSFFGDTDPQYILLREMEEHYGKLDNGIIVIEANSGTILDREGLELIEKSTKYAWDLPYATKVESLTNYIYSWSENDNINVKKFVEEANSLNEEQIKQIKTVVDSEEVVFSRFIANTGKISRINISFTYDNNSPEEKLASVTELRRLVKKIDNENHNYNIYLSGTVVGDVTNKEVSSEDFKNLSPIKISILVLLLSVFLRSFFAVMSTLIVIVLSNIVAAGIAGWMGIELNMLSSSFYNIVLTVAAAHCVHILSNFFYLYDHSLTKEQAIIQTFEKNIRPVTITSLTTIFGFLSMNLSNLPPSRDMGNISAIGAAATLVISITLLPALLKLFPIKRRDNKGTMHYFMIRYADFVIRNQKYLLSISMISILSIIMCAPMNTVNDRFTRYLDESNQFRMDNDFIDKNMGGTYSISYIMNSVGSMGISEPEYLQKLAEFTDWLRLQPEISNVFSYSDVIERLNMNFNNNDPQFYKIPENRELSAQYLFLYELSLPVGEDLQNHIDSDHSSTLLSITFPSTDSKLVLELQNRITNWMKVNLPNYMWNNGSSLSLMFAHIGYQVMINSIEGVVIALLLVSFLLILLMRSPKYGFISIAPNLFPIALGFGVWGLLHGEVGMNLAVSLGLTIGLIVDDTVHFVMKYMDSKSNSNCSADEAIRSTFSSVGPALCITTFTILIGFSPMLLSSYQVISDGTAMMMLIVGLAFLIDMTFLPSLLLHVDKRKVT